MFSQAWYRVAMLKPRLRSHVQIHRQRFRDKEWYVLQDHSSGRFHRISSEAYFIIGLMDGKRTMADIWDAACEHLLDDVLTQDEIINLLSQIHRFEALQSELPPDMSDLSERGHKEKRNRLLNYLMSPTSLRFPLFDPDRFLDRTITIIRPLLGWGGILVWVTIVSYALLLAGIHWNELTSNVTERVLSLENLLILSLIYPLVKILHEFGHAYTVKRWGGEVHEMGVMMLVFMPIPYVDATSSYAFRHKGMRMLVGASGIFVELLLAAIAMIVWAKAGPGILRTVAYNIMIIGGISTLLMNGNPLIRYDAYYILSDFLEIPNLATRSSEYLSFLAKRWLFGIKEAESTAANLKEALWLSFYGIASFVYRAFITFVIALYIAGKFFIFGVIIAGWTLVGFIVLPLVRAIRSASATQLFHRYRTRSAVIGAVFTTLLLILTFFIHFPSFTVAEGVVWVPDESQVISGADGFITEIVATPGSRVRTGELLIRCTAPKLDKELNVLSANLSEVEARYLQSIVTDRTATEILREERAKARAELFRARERFHGLLMRSRSDGTFLIQQPEDMPGRYVKKGTPLGYVVDFTNAKVRVVVDQDSVEQIRNRTVKIEARLAGNMSAVLPAKMVGEVPAASNELPSMALSTTGGGSIALDPSENKKPQAFKKHFIFDIILPGTQLKRIGERAFIRFVHQPETPALRCYRKFRSLLISKFDL